MKRENMEFEINIEKKDNIEGSKNFTKKLSYFTLGIFSIFIILTKLFTTTHKSSSDIIIDLLIELILSWSIFFIFKAIFYISMKYLDIIPTGTVGKHKFIFGDNSIREESEGSIVENTYSNVTKIIETPKYFFLKLKTGRGYVFPKREFKSKDELNKLVEILKNNIK